jgi:hypothetical protein
MGHEHTLPADTWDITEAEKVLLRLTDQVARRMRKKGYLGNVISMRLRFSDFESVGRQKKIEFYTDEERVIYRVARDLMHRHWRPGQAIRLVGVHCSGLVKIPDVLQVDLFRQKDGDSHRKLLTAVDKIRDKYGEQSITRARLLSHDKHMWGAPRRVAEPRFQRMRVGADPTSGMGWSPMSRWHDASGSIDSTPLNSSISTSPFDMLRRQDRDDVVRSGKK